MFATEREALDFLAAHIAAEAKREQVPLSEVERKMLYFSETAPTLPDMTRINKRFEETYDNDEYEQKIAGLIRHLVIGHHWMDQDEKAAWDAAIERLSGDDFYFFVLLDLSRKNPLALDMAFCRQWAIPKSVHRMIG